MTKGAVPAGARPALGEAGHGDATVLASEAELGVKARPNSTRTNSKAASTKDDDAVQGPGSERAGLELHQEVDQKNATSYERGTSTKPSAERDPTRMQQFQDPDRADGRDGKDDKGAEISANQGVHLLASTRTSKPVTLEQYTIAIAADSRSEKCEQKFVAVSESGMTAAGVHASASEVGTGTIRSASKSGPKAPATVLHVDGTAVASRAQWSAEEYLSPAGRAATEGSVRQAG